VCDVSGTHRLVQQRTLGFTLECPLDETDEATYTLADQIVALVLNVVYDQEEALIDALEKWTVGELNERADNIRLWRKIGG
jgi:hypothetical protein